jgi:hypothetical protein
MAPIEVGNTLPTIQRVDVTWVNLTFQYEVEKYAQPNDPRIDRLQT